MNGVEAGLLYELLCAGSIIIIRGEHAQRIVKVNFLEVFHIMICF